MHYLKCSLCYLHLGLYMDVKHCFFPSICSYFIQPFAKFVSLGTQYNKFVWVDSYIIMAGKTTGLPLVKLADPHRGFTSAKPELGDPFLINLQNVVIVPGIGSAYESFVSIAPKQYLEKGHTIAIFIDPSGLQEFDKLVLWAVAIVVDRSPLVLSTFKMDAANTDALPKTISLFAVQNVFVFGSLGVKTLAEIFDSIADFPKLVAYEAPVFNRTMPSSMGSVGHTLPGPPGGSSDSHRARKNAVECQNIKALFRNNTKSYLEFVGAMEDLGGDHAIAAVQKAVPLSLLNVIALKPVNMKKTLTLMFQLVVAEDQDNAKAFPGLHLTHFRFPNSVVSTFAQIKACYLNFKHILCAMTGNHDGTFFMENAFASSLERLNSVEEQSMSKMEPSVVKHELSVRLVNFSMVLSAAAALAEDEGTFLSRLRVALCVDETELLQKNYWALSRKMTESLAAARQVAEPRFAKKAKFQGNDFGRSADPGAGAAGKSPGQGSKIGFCIAEVCFKFLVAGTMYDTKPVKACIHGVSCRFNHSVPNAPVTAVQKAEFINLANLLGPERKAALLGVMAKPTFSK